MPIHPTYPGVYVQELPSSVHTIMGVATSITAFVGRASDGAVNTVQRVLNFTDYLRLYGPPDESSPLGYSVQQFFLNGGNEALIVRVGAGAVSAGLDLLHGTQKVLRVEARAQGQGGNLLQVAVSSATLPDGSPGFDLMAKKDQNPPGRPEHLSGLSMDPRSARYAPDVVAVESRYIRLLDLSGAIKDADDPRKGQKASLLGGAVDDARPIVGADRDLRVAVDGKAFENLQLALPKPAEGAPAGEAPPARTLASIAADLNTQGDTRGFTCAVEGHSLKFASKSAGPASRIEVAAGLRHDAARELKLFPMDGAVATPVAALILPDVKASTHLADGSDGNVAEVPAVYFPMTDSPVREGVFALEDIDLFNLLVLPGVKDPGVLEQAAQYCEQRRAILLVDMPESVQSPQEAGALADRGALTAAKNAAAYYPWVQLPNPDGGKTIRHPPSGTVAGLIARTDSNRGVWKAPAGTEAALVNVQGLDYMLTDAENGLLNPLGVNCLRSFRGFGPVAWGARTRRGADDLTDQWKYLPVRRTALYIEESLYRGLKWVVFEPNDEPLWAQIRLNVGVFMHDLFRQGAFQGLTPRDAYLVKCDRETTTQSDIDRGVVNVLVGFAPLKPAEFVILSLQQLAGQLQV